MQISLYWFKSPLLLFLLLSLLLFDWSEANFYSKYHRWHNQKSPSIEYISPHFRFMFSDRNNMSSPGCGTSAAVRIVGGTEAIEGAYPFVAVVLFQHHTTGTAVIIGNRWILTAAHLFHQSQNPDDFLVGVGSVFVEKATYSTVKRIIVHEKYQRKQLFDIALIELDVPLKYSLRIRPICLPSYSYEPVSSRTVRVAGWGFQQYNSGQASKHLREVDLPMISLEQCRRSYGHIHIKIVRSQICTWSPDKDACSGDSGGPMYSYKKDRAVLYGLVSFGVKCADQFPGVYTAVSYYLNWIHAAMK